MRRQRQQVDAERPDVHRDLAHRLHRVGVHQGPVLVGNRRERRDRLDGADFIVRVHHGDERCVAGYGVAEAIDRNNPCVVDREERRAPAAPGERLEGIEDRLVLDAAGDEMTPSRPFESLGGAADREVVGFGAAAGEDDLRRIAAHERRNRRPRLVQQRFGLLAEVMHARRVSKLVARRSHNRVDDFGRQRGRRVVVKVDTHQ